MPTELRADCANCAGLCCVASTLTRSADFAIDKEAGEPCPHLREDFRCGIHDRLRPRGFPGCAVYDCFGAGQQVTQITFGGRDWRRSPQIATSMFEVFGVMRQLHELLRYVTDALTLAPAHPVYPELRSAFEEVERLTLEDPDTLVALDVAARRRDIAVLLRRASALTRADVAGRGADHAGADLVGKDLRGTDLRGADLRGAYLIGARLDGADLQYADVLGADLRGARLAGADLTGALFLLQSQLDAATGDATTAVPAALTRPAHWLR